jgi:DNA-binding CsgD family transcriptional regulator
MQIGIVLLDTTGRVISANAEARLLLPLAESVFTDGETVDLPSFQVGRSKEPVRVQAGGVSLEVQLEPMMNGGPEVSHLVLLLKAAWTDGEARRRMLVQRYRMTPAEVRLAEQLLDGMTAAMAAQSLGVSIHTVRTYLKRLYQKTGVRNQALLMRTLLQAVRP